MLFSDGLGRHLGGISRALSARNYRVYWYGHVFSSNGVWIYMISSQWLMFYLTQSPIWLGTVGFAYMAPLFFLGPLAGVVADRYGPRRTSVITLSLGIATSLLTAVVIATGKLTPILMVMLTVFQGIFVSFDFPARQALIPQLVERKNLSAAIGMNFTTFQVAGFIGPILGGAILSWGNNILGEPMGAAIAYTVSALALCCMVVGIVRVRVVHILPHVQQSDPLFAALISDLRAGISYVMEIVNLKIIIVLSVLVGLLLRPYQYLMAGFAKEVFEVGEQGLGGLLAAAGIGALIAAIILAVRGSTNGLTRVYVYGVGLTAVGLLVFVSSREFPVAIVSIAFVGGFIAAAEIGVLTIVQNIVIDEYRARVISIILAIVVGVPAFGSLALGWLADRVGFQVAQGVAVILALIFILPLGRILVSRSVELEAQPFETE